MRITKIELINIRCFKTAVLEFNDNMNLAVITGDNSSGKTVLLRCIAMGLCDDSSASALLRELPGEFVRHGEKYGTILINLKDDDNTKYRIRTKITSFLAFERVTQKWFLLDEEDNETEIKDLEKFPWEKIFVSGYGAGLRTQGTADYKEYFSADAVYPLFRYDTPLQNPELAFRRALDDGRQLDHILGREKVPKKNIIDDKKTIDNETYEDKTKEYLTSLLSIVLELEGKDIIEVTKTGIEIETHKWGRIELGALGDGYQSTITWILDLISWWILYLNQHNEHFITNKDIKGIVIIDEYEQHLHPRWQIDIIGLLIKAFPKVQFIITTHAPLIVINSTRLLEKDTSKLFNINFDGEDANEITEITENMAELTADQVLASESFNFIPSTNKEVEQILREASKLAIKEDRTEKEEKIFNELKLNLKNIMFPRGKTLIERVVERAYLKDIEENASLFKKMLEEIENDKD